jgi:hypothetical protein
VYQLNDNKVLIYNIETKEEKMLDEKTFSEKVVSYTWNGDSNRAVLRIDKKEGSFYYILDSQNISNSFFLQDKMSFLPFLNNLYFSPMNPDEIIGADKKNLYRISISSSKADIIAENISHLIQKKNFFYYLDKDNSLIQLDPRSYRASVILEKFELSDDFDLLPMNRESSIYMKNKGSLYLIEDKNNLKLIDDGVDKILPENSDDQFIYTKGFEIWNYDTAKENASLITRFSKKIENIQEFFADKYLIYQQGQDIEVIKKDAKNNQEIRNNVEDVKIFNKYKMVIVEPKDNQKLFKLIDLTPK